MLWTLNPSHYQCYPYHMPKPIPMHSVISPQFWKCSLFFFNRINGLAKQVWMLCHRKHLSCLKGWSSNISKVLEKQTKRKNDAMLDILWSFVFFMINFNFHFHRPLRLSSQLIHNNKVKSTCIHFNHIILQLL